MTNPGGKGSTPRPLSVSQEQYAQRWDAIFGKDNPVVKDSLTAHMLKNDAVFYMSEKRAENLSEIVQDSAEMHRIFEGDADELANA